MRTISSSGTRKTILVVLWEASWQLSSDAFARMRSGFNCQSEQVLKTIVLSITQREQTKILCRFKILTMWSKFFKTPHHAIKHRVSNFVITGHSQKLWSSIEYVFLFLFVLPSRKFLLYTTNYTPPTHFCQNHFMKKSQIFMFCLQFSRFKFKIRL